MCYDQFKGVKAFRMSFLKSNLIHWKRFLAQFGKEKCLYKLNTKYDEYHTNLQYGENSGLAASDLGDTKLEFSEIFLLGVTVEAYNSGCLKILARPSCVIRLKVERYRGQYQS